MQMNREPATDLTTTMTIIDSEERKTFILTEIVCREVRVFHGFPPSLHFDTAEFHKFAFPVRGAGLSDRVGQGAAEIPRAHI